MTVIAPIFTKLTLIRQPSVRNFYTEFHKIRQKIWTLVPGNQPTSRDTSITSVEGLVAS